MDLKVGDQLKIKDDIGQVIGIETPESFFNLLDAKTYLIKTMNHRDVLLTDEEIAESDNIEFYKSAEDRDFDVMEEYNHIFP